MQEHACSQWGACSNSYSLPTDATRINVIPPRLQDGAVADAELITVSKNRRSLCPASQLFLPRPWNGSSSSVILLRFRRGPAGQRRDCESNHAGHRAKSVGSPVPAIHATVGHCGARPAPTRLRVLSLAFTASPPRCRPVAIPRPLIWCRACLPAPNH
jgi:hypothetical protein